MLLNASDAAAGPAVPANGKSAFAAIACGPVSMGGSVGSSDAESVIGMSVPGRAIAALSIAMGAQEPVIAATARVAARPRRGTGSRRFLVLRLDGIMIAPLLRIAGSPIYASAGVSARVDSISSHRGTA